MRTYGVILIPGPIPGEFVKYNAHKGYVRPSEIIFEDENQSALDELHFKGGDEQSHGEDNPHEKAEED